MIIAAGVAVAFGMIHDGDSRGPQGSVLSEQSASPCPHRLDTRAFSGGQPPRIRLPRQADDARLCRYLGWNDAPSQGRAGTLAREVQLESGGKLDTLISKLHQLQFVKGSGGISCPNDDGSAILITVFYADRASHELEAALSGCRFVRAVSPRGRALVLLGSVERYLRSLLKTG